MFVLAVCSGFEVVVQPANLRSQDAGDLPMERWDGWRKCAADLSTVAQQVRGVRAFLRHVFLVAAYIADEPVSLRRYWYCFSLSPKCNLLHTRGKWSLPAHLFPILFEGRFRECELPVRVRPFTGRNRIYHPACQCVAPGRIPPVMRRSGRPEWLSGAMAGARNWERLVLVLHCQTETAASKWKTELSTTTPLGALPRVTVADHIPSKSQRACTVSRTAYEALREIDEGLVHAQCFWESFSASTIKYCVGERGVSARMRSIQDAAAVAFALNDILSKPIPSAAHEEALIQLYREVKPDLKRRPWPPDSYEAAPAIKSWPNEKGIVVFYQRWWTNVYEAGRAVGLPFAKRWRAVDAVVVQPVRARPLWAGVWQLTARKIVCKRKKADFAARMTVWKFTDIIASFLEGGKRWVGVFQVSVKDLDTTAPVAQGCFLGPGAVGRLRTPRLRKKLVRAVALQTRWDTRAVAASLQHEARFAKPAYYINAMFALVVRFGNTSSPCERWAHELKLLWDPQRTQPASTLIHRLHGRVAGLRGDGTDEAFLHAVQKDWANRPNGFRHKPRNRRGQALATWRAEKVCERDKGPTRVLYQRPAEETPKARAESQRIVLAEDNLLPGHLDTVDLDLLSRIRLRDRGLVTPGNAKGHPADLGSAMPWCADTKAQWDRDLARSRREVMTSERAAAFFSRRDEGRPPRPQELAHSSSASSTSSSSSSSSASSAHSAGGKGAVGSVAAVSWAHKGGASRIHGFEGAVEQGTAAFVCRPSNYVTAAFVTGVTTKHEEAELVTGARWCKRCFQLLW